MLAVVVPARLGSDEIEKKFNPLLFSSDECRDCSGGGGGPAEEEEEDGPLSTAFEQGWMRRRAAKSRTRGVNSLIFWMAAALLCWKQGEDISTGGGLSVAHR